MIGITFPIDSGLYLYAGYRYKADMKILLSNDDGYQAPGLAALFEALSDIADTTVIAPESNRSCASSSLSVQKPITVRTAANGMMYVDGTPGDCVHLGINGLLDFIPDMVVSGINAGSNIGDDVIYSGTVAAAIEGRFLGLPAIAVSLVGEKLDHYETAGRVVRQIIQNLEVNPLHRDTILNVNVPDIPLEQVEGVYATRCGSHHQSQPSIPISINGDEKVFRIGSAGVEADAGPGTDFHAVENGFISVTPLQIDLTKHSSIEELATWLPQ